MLLNLDTYFTADFFCSSVLLRFDTIPVGWKLILVLFGFGASSVGSGLSGLIFGIIFGISEAIPEMVPDDHHAPFLGPSGTSFGIIMHQFWDCQAPVLGSHAYF